MNKSDRPGSDHRDAVVACDGFRERGRVEAGRQDVATEQDLFVREVFRVPVVEPSRRLTSAVGIAHVLGLGSLEAAGEGPEPQGAPVATEVEPPLLALGALAAGDQERPEHPVADGMVLDLGPGLLDHADELVSDDASLLHPRRVPVEEMEVRPADRGQRDLHDGVARPRPAPAAARRRPGPCPGPAKTTALKRLPPSYAGVLRPARNGNL